MSGQYPFYNTIKYRLVLSFAYGVFLFLFLMAFLPFGVSNYNPQHEYTLDFLLEMGIFLPVTILASLTNEFGIRPLLKRRSDSLYIIGWTTWSLIFIGLIIFTVYNFLGDWHDWQLNSLPGFLFNVAMVLIFPAVGCFFYFRFLGLRKNYDAILTNPDQRIDPKDMLHFTGEGTKDRISISVSDFIYARAQDNYIELHFLKHSHLTKFLIRSSLARLDATKDHGFLVRCHRSYLVNLYNVHSIKGSLKDLKIILSHIDLEIPVSKTYSESTLEQLRYYKGFQ